MTMQNIKEDLISRIRRQEKETQAIKAGFLITRSVFVVVLARLVSYDLELAGGDPRL
jgi:hypothetical protein